MPRVPKPFRRPQPPPARPTPPMPAGHVGWGSPRKIEQSEDDLVAAGQRALATLVPPTIGAAPQYVPQTRGNFGLPLPHDEDPE